MLADRQTNTQTDTHGHRNTPPPLPGAEETFRVKPHKFTSFSYVKTLNTLKV